LILGEVYRAHTAKDWTQYAATSPNSPRRRILTDCFNDYLYISMGFEAHILCIAFYFKGTKDICLEVRRPDRLAHFSPHLICLQGMHLDSSR